MLLLSKLEFVASSLLWNSGEQVYVRNFSLMETAMDTAIL